MILFFGPPGSGKSVQGELLVERNGWQWLSTGQLFRDSKDPEVLARLATGELIDDELTNKVLKTALTEADDTTKIVLDGYPRNVDQAQWLISNLPEFKREISCVIQFVVPKEELVTRLSGRGRSEDSADVVERRLDIYEEKTKPVLDFYAKSGTKVFEIDGVGTPEEVHERIQSVVESCIRA